MSEDVGVEQVGLVEEEDGVDAGLCELMNLRGDRVEDGRGGGLGGEAEGDAQLPIEIAAAEGGVVAVGEAEALPGEALAQSAQDAGLADAGLAREEHGVTGFDGVDEVGDERLLRRREPEIGVGDLL